MGSKNGSRRAKSKASNYKSRAGITDAAPTSAAAWTKSSAVETLRLPSGNVCRVKRVGPEAFMSQGIMPDMLAPIVQKSINNKKGLPPQKIEQMATDPKMLGQISEMCDRVTVYAVVEPRVVMPPNCQVCGELNTVATESVHGDGEGKHEFQEGPRDPALLYVDTVDLEDKMFIMNFCVGGTRDLERFREQQREVVAGVDPQPSDEGASV